MFYQYDVPIPERQTRLDTPPQPEYSCDATWPSQKRKSKRWHNAVNLFERLAAATWVRIGCAEHLRTRFGEVAITETNLLDIKVEGNLLAQVRLSNQKEEAKLGFDFELWIGSSRARSWWRYCVQAKKLGQRQLKYENLGYKVKTSGGKSQGLFILLPGR